MSANALGGVDAALMGPLLLALALVLNAAVVTPAPASASARPTAPSPGLRRVVTPAAAAMGFLILAPMAAALAAGAWWLQATPIIGPVMAVVLAAALLPQRALIAASETVAAALGKGDGVARLAVSRLLDARAAEQALLASVDAKAIAHASVAITARRFARDVAAPAFWFLLFGLAGLVVARLVSWLAARSGPGSLTPTPLGAAASAAEGVLAYAPVRAAALLIAATAPAPGLALRAVFRAGQGRFAAPEAALRAGLGRASGDGAADLRAANHALARAWILLVSGLLLSVCAGMAWGVLAGA